MQRTLTTLQMVVSLSLAGLLSSGCPGDPKEPPKIISFTASSTSIPFGGGDVTLSWVQTDAKSLEITGVGNVSGRSSVLAHVTQTTTFTLTASNKKGATQ